MFLFFHILYKFQYYIIRNFLFYRKALTFLWLISVFNMIVHTNIPYNSQVLKEDINSLKNKYSFIKVSTIGYSFLGKPLYCLTLGSGKKEVLYFGSIHANEWIVSPVLMKFIEDLSEAFSKNGKIYGYNAKEILEQATIYIVPMLNPDGVDLVTNFINQNSNPYKYARIISRQYPNIPFPAGWKANLNGVDLNLQFPAGWLRARQIKYNQGFVSPAPRDFVGYGPLTEVEALAIYNFTLSHNFYLTISYHTQGREIYWNFQNINPPRGYEIGQQFANASGYSLAQVPYNSSFAGYKDWFIQKYNRPRLYY